VKAMAKRRLARDFKFLDSCYPKSAPQILIIFNLNSIIIAQNMH
jgi:hypothetical protein